MRYVVKARVKPGRGEDLLRAISDQSLGRGSIAGDEYLRDMDQARLNNDGTVHWVEVCFCLTPLAEERAYWEEYFELLSVKDAHARRNCRDWNGTEPWACSECDCTRSLEAKLRSRGQPFIESLCSAGSAGSAGSARPAESAGSAGASVVTRSGETGESLPSTRYERTVNAERQNGAASSNTNVVLPSA